MKVRILIIALLAILSLKSFAQDIEYYYDLAGNRQTRQVIGTPPPEQAEAVADTINNSEQTKSEPEVYQDIVAEKQLKIYPNPTRGHLKIDMVNYNKEAKGSIQVFDLGGRMVYSINNLSESMEIDIASQPAGSYIMIIVVDNEKSEWKIIKQ